MPLFLQSPSFRNYQSIPLEFTGDGANHSPPLNWGDAPIGTRELALLCDDPDAPQDLPFCHWLIYDLSPLLTNLPAAVPPERILDAPVHALQGINAFGEPGYGGPLPPIGHGKHRYFFRLFALDRRLKFPAEMRREEFLQRINGHVLETAELVGLHERVENLRLAAGWAP